MTKKSRLLLFVLLFVLFLGAAPTTLFYSWGWRFDFENKKITQTGGFYFKVLPKTAQIHLDGKSAKRTDFFFGAVYIDDILPKSYEVEIKKDGYHAWQKTLEVQERQVTEAKNIVLLPQNPEFNVAAQNVEELPEQATSTEVELAALPEGKISPDRQKLAYLSNSEVWVLFSKEQLGQPPKKAGQKLLIGRFSEKIGQVFWLTSHYLIFTAGDKIKIAEIDDRDKINIIDFAEFPEPEIFFNQTDKKLYVLSQGNLYASERLLP